MKTKRSLKEVLEFIALFFAVFGLLLIAGLLVWLVISVLVHTVVMALHGEWPLVVFIVLAVAALALAILNKHIPADGKEA